LEEWSSRGLDFHAVASELQTCLEEERREAEVPPPRGQGQLTVLTVHGSKGLEFDHVILIDLPARSARPGDSPLLYWDRKEGAYLVRRDEDGDRDSKNTENARWKDLEKAKALAESKRLFYVALTRARERLWLVYPPSAKAPKELETGWEETLGKDYWRGWIEASARVPAYDFASATKPVLGAGASPEEAQSPMAEVVPSKPSADLEISLASSPPAHKKPIVLLHRPRYSVTEWNLLGRCPRSFEWSRVRPRLGERRKDEDNEQTELGTEVHRLLELGDFEGLRSLGAAAAADWAQSDPLMLPPDPTRGRQVWKEFSFEVSVQGETLVGSMDRLVLDAGRYTVVDFKFTKKLKREAELFEAYGNQVRLYARALELLEPAAQGKIDVVIVNLTYKEAKSWKLPLDKVGQDPDRLAAQAAAIVAGSEGMARISSLCGTCPHRRQCPEAQAQ
jgi:ATP-dependent exoDNAse (exonuclease V) beta subunit